MSQGPIGIRGPGVASPGTTITVEVDSPGSVAVTQPGGGLLQIPVHDGHATIPIPANATPGSQLHVVVLGRLPPQGLSVTVVAK